MTGKPCPLRFVDREEQSGEGVKTCVLEPRMEVVEMRSVELRHHCDVLGEGHVCDW